MDRDSGVTTDAIRCESFNFSLTLKSVHDNLSSSDLKAIKFLCSDFISSGKMDRIKSALDLFRELETLQMIRRPDDVTLIEELLFCIRRLRLLKTLTASCLTDDVERNVRDGRCRIHSCRIFLNEICDDLTMKDFDTLKQCLALDATISRSAIERMEDPRDLLLNLEKLNLIEIRKNDIQFLKNIFKDLNLENLVHKIEQYEEQRRFKTTRQQLNDLNERLPIDNNNLTTKSYRQTIENQHEINSECNTTSVNDDGVKNLQINVKSSSSTSKNDDCDFREDPRSEGSDALSPPSGFLSESFCSPISGENADVYQAAGGAGVDSPISPLTCSKCCCSPETEKRRQENYDDEEFFYSMKNRPRGICLIINNSKSDPNESGFKERTGSDIDCHSLEEVFQKFLHFKIVVKNNQTDVDICQITRELATTTDHSNYDCFVCCILSHGTLGKVYGVNGKPVEIKDIMADFKPHRCPSLAEKPKVFIIQACQGSEIQDGFDLETDGPTDVGKCCANLNLTKTQSIPNESDFLVALSTVPGYASIRSKSKGSWYITCLVKALKDYSTRFDLLDILTKVNGDMSQYEGKKKGKICKQVGTLNATLRKKILFN